jgi:molybdenum cofactor cytidylyltransferase
MRKARDVALVLLAAGTSQRFGQEDKLLARVGGKHLIEHCLDRLATLDFGERIAVVHAGSGAAGLLAAAGYTLALNPAPQTGMGGSLALGVTAIARSRACLVYLADMPLVSITHLEAILGVDSDIVASSLDGVKRPPALFDALHFDALKSVRGDQGARALLHRADSVPSARHILADVNSTEDLSCVSAMVQT